MCTHILRKAVYNPEQNILQHMVSGYKLALEARRRRKTFFVYNMALYIVPTDNICVENWHHPWTVEMVEKLSKDKLLRVPEMYEREPGMFAEMYSILAAGSGPRDALTRYVIVPNIS